LIIGDSFVKKLNDSMTMFKKIMHGQKVLFGMKIGILGESSPWLIASGINKTTVQEDFKIKFISIQVEELIEEYKSFSRNYTESKIDEFVKEVDKMVALYHSHLSEGRTEADLREAVIMYFAIYDICKKYKLDAVTIRCFSLINSCKTTACLALAILNDKGIIAGCEGDIPALLSMASVAKLTKEPCFMANISSIDTDNYSIDLSHCTIPLSMTKKFSLPSHFESRKGIGINGIVQEGNYTLFKFSGMNMEQSILCPGRVVKCDYLKERCRTQIRFVFDNKEDFNKFLNCRIANHVVINKTVDI
jgi:L-fucose isomerase-like protein